MVVMIMIMKSQLSPCWQLRVWQGIGNRSNSTKNNAAKDSSAQYSYGRLLWSLIHEECTTEHHDPKEHAHSRIHQIAETLDGPAIGTANRGDSRKNRFARINSQKENYVHNVWAIHGNGLKPCDWKFLVPGNAIRKEKGSVREPPTWFARISRAAWICESVHSNRAI